MVSLRLELVERDGSRLLECGGLSIRLLKNEAAISDLGDGDFANYRRKAKDINTMASRPADHPPVKALDWLMHAVKREKARRVRKAFLASARSKFGPQYLKDWDNED